jgi:hypothetical protein
MVMPAHDPTAMYRTSLVRGIRFDESLPVVEGYDYILRVGERWPLMVVGECLYSYRVHLKSVTKRDPDKRDRLVDEVIRRACERRGVEWDGKLAHPGPRKLGRNAHADNNLAAQFMESVLHQRHEGRRISAVRTGLQCSGLHPTDLHYHKALVYSLLPLKIVRHLRKATF